MSISWRTLQRTITKKITAKESLQKKESLLKKKRRGSDGRCLQKYVLILTVRVIVEKKRISNGLASREAKGFRRPVPAKYDAVPTVRVFMEKNTSQTKTSRGRCIGIAGGRKLRPPTRWGLVVPARERMRDPQKMAFLG